MKVCKKLLTILLCLALTSSLVPLAALAAPVLTDIKGHWAQSSINSAVSRGYVKGYEDNSFRPNNAVTRAEFCKMLNAALALRQSSGTSFSDVPSNQWYAAEVSRAVSAGYITGYDDASFRPANQITRQEAAVVLSRIITEPSANKALSELRDASSIDAWALEGAQSVYSKSYMAGDNQKNFNPRGNLTRAEAVKIIEGVLGGEAIKGDDTSLSQSGQVLPTGVYTGSVNVTATNGSVNLKGARVLGTVNHTGGTTLQLQDAKIANLNVNTSAGNAEVQASGKSEIARTTLQSGATLTETSLSGKGFEQVDLTGSRLSSQDVSLSGSFKQLNFSAPASLYLRSGSIAGLRVLSAGTGSKVNLASGTNLQKAVLDGTADFSGRGTINLAVVNVAGSSFETPPLRTEGSSTGFTPTISPSNGSKSVSLSSNIVLTFAEIPYTSSNTVVTESYVKNSLVELRRGSKTGTSVSFDVSLANNNRSITLDPIDNLVSNTTYYVVIKSALRNSYGQMNAAATYSFSTGTKSLSITPYPADDADMIPITTPIRLEFDEAVYQSNGSSTLSASYLKDTALELRSGSQSGSSVDFSASIGNNNRTITITPRRSLATDTRYYLIVKSGTLANSSRESISAQSYNFTTADSSVLVPAMTPSSGASKVSLSTDIVLDFDTRIYTSSGGSMSTSYLRDDVLTLRRDSANGSSVSFDVSSLSSDHTRVTLSPRDALRENTSYYLTLNSRTLSNSTSSSRDYNSKMVLSFTTGSTDSRGELDPLVSPRKGATGVSTSDNITLDFDTAIYRAGSSNSSLNSSYLESSVLELRSGSEGGSHVGFDASISGNRSLTINPTSALSTGTRYYVIVRASSLQNSNGDRNNRYVSYFDTSGTGSFNSPTVTPSNGATGVAPSTSITLDFGTTLYNEYNEQLSNNSSSYNQFIKENHLLLRRGSESGDIMRFSVTSISSSGRVIIAPESNLLSGYTYYLIVAPSFLRNSSGQYNSRFVSKFTVGSGLTASANISTGSTNIDRNKKIIFYFNERVYENRSGLNDPSSSYLTSSITSSPNPGFTARLTNNNTQLELTPSTSLLMDQRYDISLLANRFKTADGRLNSAHSFYFKTNATAPKGVLSPTSNVGPSTTLTLDFKEALYTKTGGTLSSANGLVKVYRDSVSSSNLVKDVTLAFTSNKQGITIHRTNGWDRGKTYYIVMDANAIANYNKVPNASQSLSFTTEAVINLGLSSISIGAPESSNTQEITLNFNAALAPLSSDILSKLTISKAGGAVTPTAAKLSGNSVILTCPLLDPSTSYTVAASANAFSDENGNTSLAISQAQTSPAPMLDLSVQAPVDSSQRDKASVTLSYSYPGTLSLSLGGGVGSVAPSGSVTTSAANSSYTWNLTGLSDNTKYTVTLVYTSPSGAKTETKEANFTIAPLSDKTEINALSVTTDGTTYNATSSDKNWSVEVPKGSTCSISATSSPKASVSYSVQDSSSVLINEDPVDITITVTAEDGSTTTTYTLTIKPF